MNKTAIKLKNDLINWLTDNGIPDLYVDYEEDFGYAINDNNANIRCLNIGVAKWTNKEDKLFEQFLYEYGCEYINIPSPVLAFLHETGHHMTISNFSDMELRICLALKGANLEDEDNEDYNFYFYYWMIMDEFAANMWAINFINNHIDAVNELSRLFYEGWNEICKEMNPFDLVEEDYYAA